VEYFGFELEREAEAVRDFPPALADEARHLLAEAVARGDARQLSVKRNRASVEAVREAYRRSGGVTPRLGLAELTAIYEQQLQGVNSMEEFRNARLVLNADDFVSPAERERYEALPNMVLVREREAWIDYDVEHAPDGSTFGVARLRLPEKVARTLTEAELPVLDRPLRFSVTRGQRGMVKAATLEELQELLARPWSPAEVEDQDQENDRRSQRDRHAFRGKRQNRGGQRRRPRGGGHSRR
jgi:hypothetical protein